MKEKKYYIKNNPISKEKIQELLNIQKEQMDNLEIMLKPEIFNLLENWIRKENNILNTFIKENKTFEISNYVRRGEDLYNFIQNIPYRFDLKNIIIYTNSMQIEIACEISDEILSHTFENTRWTTDSNGSEKYTEKAQGKFNELYEVVTSKLIKFLGQPIF